MAGFVKIAAFASTGVFIVFFSLIFITRLGQSKTYKYFVGVLSMFTSVLYALLANPNLAFSDLRFILPVIGCLALLVIASFLFGKAAFAQHGQSKSESGSESRKESKKESREGGGPIYDRDK